MTKFGKILIVDDDEDVLMAGRLFLKQHVEMVQTEKNPELIPDLLKNENYDVILLDMNFTKDTTTGKEGFEWLDKILWTFRSCPNLLTFTSPTIKLFFSGKKRSAIPLKI